MKYLNAFSKVHLLAALLLVSACSVSNRTGDTNEIDAFTELTATLTLATRERLEGTGLIQFDEPLDGINSKQSYAVKALLENTDASFTLITHSNQNNLSDGIQIRLKHTGNLNITVEVSDGSGFQPYTSATLATYNDNLNLIIQVDNSEARPRVLIWRASNSEFTAVTADIDTEVHGTPLTTPALGTAWGLDLTDGVISRTRLDAAKL